jgi:actin related protein 2/3 complex subunit 3
MADTATTDASGMLVPPKKYTSAFNGKETAVLVGCGVYPVKYTAQSGGAGASTVGPRMDAEHAVEDGQFDDIVAEVLYYLKARLMLKTFPVDGAGDRLSLYLTLYLQSAIRRLSKQKQPLSQKDAWSALQVLATERIVVPGDASYPFNSMYPQAANAKETESLREYTKQLRLEAGYRLVAAMYAFPEADGSANKFWMPFARRSLLGHMLEK